MFDHLPRYHGSRAAMSRLFSRFVVGIARKLRIARDARPREPQERLQEPDILPNPWLSY
jgi:hypothetical protein